MYKILIGALTLISSSLVLADYPERSIRLVVPFATGGTSEIVARSVANSLSTSLGQPVYVDNKPGGAGNIATFQNLCNQTPLALVHLVRL